MKVDCAADAERVQAEFCFSQDLKRLDFEIGGVSSALFYVDGLSDAERFEDRIIKPLKLAQTFPKPYLETLNKITFSSDPVLPFDDFGKFTQKISDGDIGLLVDGADMFYLYSARGYSTRAIAEPPVNSVLHGPREGFTEDLKTNLTMLRRRLRTSKLVVEMFKVGKYSETAVSLLHINGVASPKVVERIKEKLQEINIDGIIDSSYIGRFLEERKFSIFRQVGINEKPDMVAAKMLEGRVAIVVDGSPVVLTLPFLLIENYQAAEDYYVKSVRGTFTRIVRIAAQIVAILLPGLYVAFQDFQYDSIPLRFLAAIMNNLYGLPFPPVLEMLLVLLFFEVLNEASVKMPRHISMSVTIVGAIVLGDAAVQAGILSGITVLVMAVSSLGIYCAPDAADGAGILRIFFVVIAGTLGLFGIVMAAMAVIAYIVGVNSAGVAMTAPLAPTLLKDFGDAVLKEDITSDDERPESIPNVNRTKMRNKT